MVTKNDVLRAMINRDIVEMRRISNLFYDISGIYERVCNYFAYLYRYDWYIAPEILDDTVKDIKKICGDIAQSIMKNGCYYGYIVQSANSLMLQELPASYCRSRYFVAGMPAIEFDMRFFD